MSLNPPVKRANFIKMVMGRTNSRIPQYPKESTLLCMYFDNLVNLR